MAALQHVVSGANREDERAFLLHHGDTLRARARIEATGLEAIELDAGRDVGRWNRKRGSAASICRWR